MEVEIVLNGKQIVSCKQKLHDFVHHDAYVNYDKRGTKGAPDPNVISWQHVTTINRMMARTPRKAWEPIIGKTLPDLIKIPHDLDLVDSDEEQINSIVRSSYRFVVEALIVPWIKDMAATKVLHLKRPRLVAISDSYVRTQLGVEEKQPPGLRAVSVAKAVRKLAQQNAEALAELKRFANGLCDPQGDPVALSKIRILDILLWVEQARHSNHCFWSTRYPP